jgi:hypothetical protein
MNSIGRRAKAARRHSHDRPPLARRLNAPGGDRPTPGGDRPRPGGANRSTSQGESGQTTTEYALVTLGAAAVALLVTAWAGGTGKIGQLLDAVIDRVIGGM